MGSGAADAEDPPPGIQAALDRLHAERHEAQTARLVAALQAAGADVIVLKGVGTARLLYGDEPRVAADVDVLVRPGDGRRAAAALRLLGYRRQDVAPHATTWIHPVDAPVDLHVTLPRSTRPPTQVWAVLSAHRSPVELRPAVAAPAVSVPVLDAPALAAHLAVHRTQGAAGPQVAEDLRRAVARFDDLTWLEARDVASELGTTTSLAWALDQVEGGPARRTQLALPEVARADLPPRSIGEQGLGAFLRSPVSIRERVRSLVGRVDRRRNRDT